MGALEQVTKMKSQGKTHEEIVSTLQDQGVSPKAINDAINQSEIKNAVSKQDSGGEMEPSMMGGGSPSSAPKPSRYTPKTQEMSEENQDYYSPNPQQNSQQNQPYYGSQNSLPTQQDYYPQEGYGDYSAYGDSGMGGFDTDTMIEISEQVFSEKIRKVQKQMEELEKFKAISEAKISHNEERLKRIESSFDKMQAAILEKIGSYGGSLESIKKEMSMMQDSFSKVLPDFAKHHKTHSKK